MFRNFILGLLKGPLRLVLIGVALGYLARMIAKPAEQERPPNSFRSPLVESEAEEDDFTDLPII